jgi:hypothetical protein
VDPKIEVYHYESTTQRGMTFVEQERLFLKHPDMSDPYFSKWFDPSDPNFRINFQQRRLNELNFGSWFDRYLARRAATMIPVGRHKLSVCACVHDQSRQNLEDMYKSVLLQSYDNKELLILDNASSNPETLEWLAKATLAGRAKIIRAETTMNNREQRQKLRESMTGDFFVAMEADDYISVDALQVLASAIELNPTEKVFYADEYDGATHYVRKSPYFKPDFDPVLLMNRCYPGHLLAVEAEFLRTIDASSDDRAAVAPAYQIVLRAVTLGEEPMHVRELLYARRERPNWANVAGSQRNALVRFLDERGLDRVLLVEPNTLEGAPETWKLTAREPLPNVKVLDVRDAWGENASISGLVCAATAPGVDWLAILASPRDRRALLELSAVAWLDPRIVAVGGLLTDPSSNTVRWSGGVFLPGGRLFDPHAGKAFSDGGHHGQLWCQRCIDVAAPVNVLIRAKALVEAAARTPVGAGSDDLMVILGLLAHERGDFIAMTPHLRDGLRSSAGAMPPVDRNGLLLGDPALERGSRWYDARLGTDPAYALWDLA